MTETSEEARSQHGGRSPLEAELQRLRREGRSKATTAEFGEVTKALRASGFDPSGTGLSETIATFLRAVSRQYTDNPSSRLLLEVFLVHETTRSQSVPDAYAVAVRRVRGTADKAAKDAFRKNELEKALRFATELLYNAEVKTHVAPSPALEHPPTEYAANFAAAWHVRYHPAEYVGPIWIHIAPDIGNEKLNLHVMVIWGDYVFEKELDLEGQAISLLHHKLEADALPLYVHVDPVATVSIGQGESPDGRRLNIDEGWVRMAGAPIKR